MHCRDMWWIFKVGKSLASRILLNNNVIILLRKYSYKMTRSYPLRQMSDMEFNLRKTVARNGKEKRVSLVWLLMRYWMFCLLAICICVFMVKSKSDSFSHMKNVWSNDAAFQWNESVHSASFVSNIFVHYSIIFLNFYVTCNIWEKLTSLMEKMYKSIAYQETKQAAGLTCIQMYCLWWKQTHSW